MRLPTKLFSISLSLSLLGCLTVPPRKPTQKQPKKASVAAITSRADISPLSSPVSVEGRVSIEFLVIGMSVKEAAALIKKIGLLVRIISVDGRWYYIKEKSPANTVDLVVNNNTVIAAFCHAR